MNQNSSYALDLLIPQGPAGEDGYVFIENLCFLEYAPITSKDNILIQNAIILPTNSQNYTLSSSTVTLNSPGNYEITLCGVFEGNNYENNLLIKLEAETLGLKRELPGMFGNWNKGGQAHQFSETNIFSFNTPQTLSFSIEISGATPFLIGSLHLIIRKLPF